MPWNSVLGSVLRAGARDAHVPEQDPKRKEAKNLLKVTRHGGGGAGTEIQAGSSNTPRRDILPLKG